MEKRMKIVLGALIGGGTGAVMVFAGKCASGTCPLLSSPGIAIGIFALAGAAAAVFLYDKK
jgi:hypothetical protein